MNTGGARCVIEKLTVTRGGILPSSGEQQTQDENGDK